MGKNVINSKENKEEMIKIIRNAYVLIGLFKKYLSEKDEREEFFFNSVGYAVMFLLYTSEANSENIPWERRAERFIQFLELVKDDIPKYANVGKGDC